MLDKDLLAIASGRVFNYQNWLKIKEEKLSPREIRENLPIIKSLFGKKKYQKLKKHLENFNLKKEYEKLATADIHLISPLSTDYPILFREIHSPPPALYYKGNVKLLNKKQLALIGSRAPTPYSYHCVNSFLNNTIIKNLVITSGLAKGIDAAAHYRALELGGKTIAVLGYGLLSPIYPRENYNLVQKILENDGLIISEYYPDEPALGCYFAQRNRIIAALADKILIISAKTKSGSLITARHGIEFNKDILVCPGPISSDCFQGSHDLIKEGAALVSCHEDIAEAFNLQILKNHKDYNPNFTIEEITVLNQLHEPLNFHQLMKKTTLDRQKLNHALLLLESKKVVIKKGLYYYH